MTNSRESIVELFGTLKAEKPRIHMIPNDVSASFCADVLAAIGAKPIMAVSPQEVATITSHASTLVVNMGQLTAHKCEAIQVSLQQAVEASIPVVFDPVGVGASAYRLKAAQTFLDIPWQGIIKLNQSEYEALQKKQLTHTGVDGTGKKIENVSVWDNTRTFCLTGETDWLCHADKRLKVAHRPSRLPQIVGSGCALGALCGATLGVANHPLIAATLASLLFSIAAQEAEDKACGYMDFKLYFIDALYQIKEEKLLAYAKQLVEGEIQWI